MNSNNSPEALGDAIHVEGLKVWARVGVLPEERSLGQWFVVDLSIWLDLAPAGRSDDLSLTVDYGQAVAAIQACSEQALCHTRGVFFRDHPGSGGGDLRTTTHAPRPAQMPSPHPWF